MTSYQLHHVHLLCSDLEHMIVFFTQHLGASLVERKKFGNADGASLNLNGTMINLRLAHEGEKVQEYNPTPQYGFHHIGLRVEDMKKAYDELTGKGYVFFRPPREVGKNIVAFFHGPDKIIIEVLQPLG
jgi:catechol 2,3-dioxygenase-like lactoylglutathione lyase family enzyme